MKNDIFQHATLTYNPLQEETAKYVQADCNIIVEAPTSSGKTIVGEQFIGPELVKGKKAVYLSPLKALTNEKMEDWSAKVPKTVMISGDVDVSPASFKNDLLLMTTEALDSKTRSHAQWIKDVGVVVCDESHLLASEGRGDAFEVGLTRFAQINKTARIVFLSATTPNVQELAKWLTILNGKKTEVVKTSWRPVKQSHHLITLKGSKWNLVEESAKHIKALRKRHRGQQMLIFVHTVNNGHKLSKALKCPFHYGKLALEERRRLEKAFKEKAINTLVSTSTLAYGINLPADVGVIVGAHRGPDMVSIADIKQEAGRIGRYGLSANGQVYYLFPWEYAEDVYKQLYHIPPIKSVLPGKLYFHITSFVTREKMQHGEVEDFLGKTLAAYQTRLDINEAIDILKEYDILKERPDGMLFPTSIARGSAFMYVDPIDLWAWKRNFKERPKSAEEIAQAYVDIPSMEQQVHVPHDLKDPIEMPFTQQQVVGSALRDWLNGKPADGYRSAIVPYIVKDFGRIASAMKFAGISKKYVETLELMIKYGIKEELLELVKIRGIGRKRAIMLHSRGISSPQQIIEKSAVSKAVLGPKVYADVKKSILSPNTFVLKF